MIRRRQIIHLSLREYLPLLLTIGFWAVIVIVLGHADAARLLAATVAMRALQLLIQLSTSVSLKSRAGSPRAVRRQAKRFALAVQTGVLLVNVVLVGLLMLALHAIDQAEIAAFLPLIAVGLPARALRSADVRTNSPYSRLALSGGGLAAALVGWLAGLGPIGMALAFGAREWIAYAVVRWWPRSVHVPSNPTEAPLTLAEIARNSAITGRRLLVYRLSKVALTMLGPAGNLAARTGRGLNWHNRIEPYLPQRLPGFILFALTAAGGAIFLALNSDQPAAMVGAAGLLQLAAASANVAGTWHWLPRRDDPNLVVDDDEE